MKKRKIAQKLLRQRGVDRQLTPQEWTDLFWKEYERRKPLVDPVWVEMEIERLNDIGRNHQ